MCCFLTSMVLLGPRAAILVWWLLQHARCELAFNSLFWPLLGFICGRRGGNRHRPPRSWAR
jgi:hypothetical protein